MSWTALEYEIIKVYGDHIYSAQPKPGTEPQVGLGHCRCGAQMYWCDHSTHFARAMIDKLGLVKPHEFIPKGTIPAPATCKTCGLSGFDEIHDV